MPHVHMADCYGQKASLDAAVGGPLRGVCLCVRLVPAQVTADTLRFEKYASSAGVRMLADPSKIKVRTHRLRGWPSWVDGGGGRRYGRGSQDLCASAHRACGLLISLSGSISMLSRRSRRRAVRTPACPRGPSRPSTSDTTPRCGPHHDWGRNGSE